MMLEGIGREEHGRILRDIAALIEDGRLRPLIDPNRFDLARLPDAFRHLEAGKAQGKVVVDIG